MGILAVLDTEDILDILNVLGVLDTLDILDVFGKKNAQVPGNRMPAHFYVLIQKRPCADLFRRVRRVNHMTILCSFHALLDIRQYPVLP